MADRPKPVEVVNWLGKRFLKALGVVMIVEGDVLRDSRSPKGGAADE